MNTFGTIESFVRVCFLSLVLFFCPQHAHAVSCASLFFSDFGDGGLRPQNFETPAGRALLGSAKQNSFSAVMVNLAPMAHRFLLAGKDGIQHYSLEESGPLPMKKSFSHLTSAEISPETRLTLLTIARDGSADHGPRIELEPMIVAGVDGHRLAQFAAKVVIDNALWNLTATYVQSPIPDSALWRTTDMRVQIGPSNVETLVIDVSIH